MYLALMYSSTESLVGHLRGQEDTLNSVAAAAVAGVLYKSTGMYRCAKPGECRIKSCIFWQVEI